MEDVPGAHWDGLAAADFFTVEVLHSRGLVRYFVFFVMKLKTRTVEIAGITRQPHEPWMTQMGRNLTDPDDGFLRDTHHLILDRDPLYTAAFRNLLQNSGVTLVRLPARSPNLSGATETFVTRLAALDLPTAMRESLAPVHHVMEVLDEELAKADAHFAALTADDPVVKRLTTCPSIGPITAAAFVAALDDVRRFDGRRGAGQVTSYLGLVPREYSSGEHQQRGRVMRSAHPYVQALLVQAAWRVCRSTDPRAAALRAWAQAIAARRGKKIATVALARRLARLLYAMWRDEVDYQPARLRPGRSETTGTTSRTAA